jgi:hypothetical protein
MSLEQYKHQYNQDIQFYIECFGKVGQDIINSCKTVEELCYYLGHL